MSAGFGYNQSDSSNSSQSGFRDLPPEFQNVFKQYASQLSGHIDSPNGIADLTGHYTPLGQTAGESQAINTINQGFVPTQQQYQDSINMQMNPYQSSVIDQVNRNAYGQNSQLQSQLNSAGQFGSNRATLGANDIANSQASTIGSLLGQQYNTASQNALTTIPALQAQSAQAQLQGGQFQRGLYSQQQQAPFTGLQTIASLLGVIPTSSSQGQGESSGFGFNVSGSTGGQK